MRFVISLFLVLTIFTTLPFPAQAADPAFTIRAGDVLQVTVWKEEGLDREIVVLPDGSITFPLAGTVSLINLTPTMAQELIKEKLKTTIPEASVSVIVKAPLGHTINVMGQVAKPGEIVMGRRLTVMQALSQAGGLTTFANEGGIKILRRINDQETSINFPYDDVADGDNLDKDITLMPGDVIVVPTAGLF
ncbi:MAG: polysaccharide biosynthesis/export family protein [Bdellovibrionales bacterium]|jgi:polysaccharide export outer membrane protein